MKPRSARRFASRSSTAALLATSRLIESVGRCRRNVSNQGWKEVFGDGEAGRYAQAAGSASLERVDAGIQFVRSAQHVLGPASDELTGRSRRRSRWGTFQQGQADLAFEIPNPAAGGRLGDAMGGSRFRQAAEFDD